MLIISLPVHYQRSQTPVHFSCYLKPTQQTREKVHLSIPSMTPNTTDHMLVSTSHNTINMWVSLCKSCPSHVHITAVRIPDATLVAISAALNKHR